MPHFMIVLIPYINLFNLSWIKKCLFLRTMEPLKYVIKSKGQARNHLILTRRLDNASLLGCIVMLRLYDIAFDDIIAPNDVASKFVTLLFLNFR